MEKKSASAVKIILAIFAIPATLSISLFFSEKTFAQNGLFNFEFKKPTLSIDIPTVSLDDIASYALNPGAPEEEQKTVLSIPYLCDYIIGIYKFAIAVGIILAVIVIIHNGIKWIISGGNVSTIGEAKNGIANAALGLILLFGGVVILQIISPELGKCKNLQILKPGIPKGAILPMESQLGGKDYFEPATEARLDTLELEIETQQKLNRALAKLKKWGEEHPEAECKIRISPDGGRRNIGEQANIWIERHIMDDGNPTTFDGGAVGRPKCFQTLYHKREFGGNMDRLVQAYKDQITNCPEHLKSEGSAHLLGVAVDLICNNTNSSEMLIQMRNNQNIKPSQQMLVKAMLAEGFCVLLSGRVENKEPWHFESVKISGGCVNNCLTLKQPNTGMTYAFGKEGQEDIDRDACMPGGG